MTRKATPQRRGPGISTGPTVAEYLTTWVTGKRSLRPSTQVSYATHVRRHIAPHLGDIPLVELQPLHIDRMYQLLLTGGAEHTAVVSAASLHRIHATLMSALNTAVRRGLIPRNPATTVELPRPPRQERQVWTAEQFARFLALTCDDRLHALYLVLGLAGLRRGEAVALRWSDVDLNAGQVRVSRSAVRVGALSLMGEPKSAAGERTVAIDDETARRLQWHQCRQRLEVLRATGVAETPALVFTTDDGHMLDPAWVSRHFQRLVRESGLPRIRLHDLRHTSASLGLQAGESLVEVSRRLGHSSVGVTADIYSHVSPAVAKRSAEHLADLVYAQGGAS